MKENVIYIYVGELGNKQLIELIKMNETLDEYYDLIEIYKDLDSYDKEMIWSIMQTVKKVGEKRKKDNKLIEES